MPIQNIDAPHTPKSHSKEIQNKDNSFPSEKSGKALSDQDKVKKLSEEQEDSKNMPELKELSASIKSDSIAENAQGPNIDADKLEDDQIQDAKFINSDE